MTPDQHQGFSLLMYSLIPGEFHHGCAEGADVEAHAVIAQRKISLTDPRINKDKSLALWGSVSIIIHPSKTSKGLIHCRRGDPVVLDSKPPLERNKDIVNAIDVLVTTPRLHTEELRSGTWATVRYARKMKRHIFIVWPNGKTTEEV